MSTFLFYPKQIPQIIDFAYSNLKPFSKLYKFIS